MLRFTSFCIILVVSLLGTACNDAQNSGGEPLFDRKEMLRNYADNLIRPAFSNLQTKVNNLKSNWTSFNTNPNETQLTLVKTAWTEAYTAWQLANAYNFGPAGEDGLKKGLIEEIATFPANTTQIEAFIANNDVSVNNFNRDARGFLSIEYLLFSNNLLLTDAPRRAYLNAMIEHLQTNVNAVVTAWDGDYATTFKAADGTDVGSSTSQLYNEFVRSFESIKNFKVGLPAGKRPGQTAPAPELSEAYYSGQSLDMLKIHINAIEQIYYGRSQNGSSGIGFKAYLDKVVGGPELVAATEAQWQNVKTALAAVPTDQTFTALLTNNHPSIEALHTELQKHTRFFKSDMSSLLGIAITFSSGDGD